MKLCRFRTAAGDPSFGLIDRADSIVDLSNRFGRLAEVFELDHVSAGLAALDLAKERRYALGEVQFLAPVDRQEIWAAGVTYLRSKAARMGESDFSATAYDRVYEAVRPELFFKALAHKVAGPGDDVGIRADATWSVPEPELALVLNSRGQIAATPSATT